MLGLPSASPITIYQNNDMPDTTFSGLYVRPRSVYMILLLSKLQLRICDTCEQHEPMIAYLPAYRLAACRQPRLSLTQEHRVSQTPPLFFASLTLI